jgi:hypothetical protein
MSKWRNEDEAIFRKGYVRRGWKMEVIAIRVQSKYRRDIDNMRLSEWER